MRMSFGYRPVSLPKAQTPAFGTEEDPVVRSLLDSIASARTSAERLGCVGAPSSEVDSMNACAVRQEEMLKEYQNRKIRN